MNGNIKQNILNNNFSSINQDHHKAGLSSKYQFIPTKKIIDIVGREGWEVSKAAEARTSKIENQGYQKHIIRFQHPELSGLGNVETGQLKPELVLFNSHDGLSSFKFMAGIFRLLCLNGLIISENEFQTVKIRHVGFDPAEVIHAIDQVMTSVPRLTDKVESFNSIQLTESQQRLYATAACSLRYKEEDFGREEYKHKYIYRLLRPRRYADNGNSLWKVFNRVQESLLNGGDYKIKLNAVGRLTGRRTKAIKSVTANIKLNQELWELTEGTARFLTAA